MIDLLGEYEMSLKAAKNLKAMAPEHDQKVHSGIITSLEFIVKWIKTGQMPESSNAGLYPSTAYLNFEEDFGGTSIDPFSRSAFEEVEERIDAERRRKVRA